MHPIALFRHCPSCGVRCTSAPGVNPLTCPACDFVYYFNPTVAACAFVFDPTGRVLFFRRAREPRKGRLAVPGGFLDIGETAEEGVRREAREEVGLDLHRLTYLGSCVNHYPYRGVTYPVVDLIFTAYTPTPEKAIPLDEVASMEWQRLEDVTPNDLAFPSIVFGWNYLTSRRGRPNPTEVDSNESTADIDRI